MNLVAASFILFDLLLPGVAFRRFYYTGEFSRQYFQDNFGQLAFRVFVPGLIAQGIWMLLMLQFNQAAQVELLKDVLMAAVDSNHELSTKDASDLLTFVLSQVSLVLSSAGLGYVGQDLVRRWGIDRRVKLFRFRNHWHYILRGGLRDFRQVKPLLPEPKEAVEMTFVQVLAGTSEGDILYDGVLADYELGEADKLERVVLMWVSRRYLREDGREGSRDDRYRRIAGDFLVIPSSQIKNLNVRYFTKVEEDELGEKLVFTDADGDVTSAAYYNSPEA